MTEFAALRPKTYGYLSDDNDENRKARDTKKVSLNENLNLKIITII